MMKTGGIQTKELVQFRRWFEIRKLETLADIYREQGDEMAAADCIRQALELTRALQAGLQ